MTASGGGVFVQPARLAAAIVAVALAVNLAPLFGSVRASRSDCDRAPRRLEQGVDRSRSDAGSCGVAPSGHSRTGLAGAAAQTASPAAAAAPVRSVWDGVFTGEQAARGNRLYAEHCARCHGADLRGAEHRALVGDRFWTTWQDTTVDRLLAYVSANMPHSEDGSLKGTLGPSVYADIVAHMLGANGFPPGPSELSAASAAGVRIVRKDGPAELPSGSFVHVVGCLAPGPDRSTWRLENASAPARIIDGQPPDPNTPLGDRRYTLRFVLTPVDKFIGHRMSVRASLMGMGGADGLNVASIQSVSPACR